MKTEILLLLLLCWVEVVCGQVKTKQDSINEARLAKIEKILEKKEKDEYAIASVKLKDSIEIKGKKIKIDSARFDLKDGMLELVSIYLNNKKVYSNKLAPIAIIYDTRFDDLLYCTTNENDSLILKEVIEFDIYKRFGFLPNNESFVLTNSNSKGIKSKILYRNGSLNSLVNFVAYSDLLGLLGDEPNALVHFEANAKFYIHRHNIFNKFMYIFPTFQPSFNYNKLDSKFDTIRSNVNSVNPTEIFRRHSYAVGVDLTVFKYDFKPSNSLELNIGYQYLSSKVYILKDSKENEIRAINHLKYIDLSFKSRIIDNFGIDLSGKYLWQTLNRSEFYEKASNTMFAFRGSIYYYPPNGNGNDKIFLRFTNYIVNNKRELDFSQIQIGFSKSLNMTK